MIMCDNPVMMMIIMEGGPPACVEGGAPGEPVTGLTCQGSGHRPGPRLKLLAPGLLG